MLSAVGLLLVKVALSFNPIGGEIPALLDLLADLDETAGPLAEIVATEQREERAEEEAERPGSDGQGIVHERTAFL
jgi:hypothetical protein